MINVCDNIKTFVNNNDFNFIEKEIVNDFIFWVQQECVDMPYGQEFRYDNFNKMIEDTLGTLHNSNRARLIDIAKSRVKRCLSGRFYSSSAGRLGKTGRR